MAIGTCDANGCEKGAHRHLLGKHFCNACNRELREELAAKEPGSAREWLLNQTDE